MKFYLVQRLIRKDNPRDDPSPFSPTRGGDRTFDDLFGAEYMGSSEFEFGALPQAYEQMARRQLSIMSVEVTRDDITKTVYVIAADDELLEDFRRWMAEPKPRSKEDAFFVEHFEGTVEEDSYKSKTVAWWSIEDNFAWALDEAIASELLEAFNAKSTA